MIEGGKNAISGLSMGIGAKGKYVTVELTKIA